MNVSESVRITTVLKDALAALKCVTRTHPRVALSRAAPSPPPRRAGRAPVHGPADADPA
jgi:hypothetical protein